MSDYRQTLQLLQEGEIVSCILTPAGSNYTFLVKIQDGANGECRAIYKPQEGEAPLWDFALGTLYKREYASYLLSQVLGWNFIPETTIREGPYGIGSVQRYIEHDQHSNYSTIRDSFRRELRVIACFDLVANNADRKASHCFEGEGGRIWSIDHGLTFHSVPKMRTVIWDFWGEPIPPSILEALESFLRDVEEPKGQLEELVDLLEPKEIEALVQRVSWLASMKGFPQVRR